MRPILEQPKVKAREVTSIPRFQKCGRMLSKGQELHKCRNRVTQRARVDEKYRFQNNYL